MNATQTLARYALKLRYRDIPSEVIGRAKACILDTLAVSLYGSTKPWSKTVSEFVRSAGSKGNATVFGGKQKASPNVPPSPMARWRMPSSSTMSANLVPGFIPAPRLLYRPLPWRKMKKPMAERYLRHSLPAAK